jgi:hypothetical protein
MKAYEARASIEASPERIWSILLDGSAYTDWDSGVVKLDGQIAPGARVKVTSEANPRRGFAVRVTDIVPNESMRWSGGIPLGLFTGVRTFTLSPASSKSMPDLQPSFDKFASGLKARAERSA